MFHLCQPVLSLPVLFNFLNGTCLGIKKNKQIEIEMGPPPSQIFLLSSLVMSIDSHFFCGVFLILIKNNFFKIKKTKYFHFLYSNFKKNIAISYKKLKKKNKVQSYLTLTKKSKKHFIYHETFLLSFSYFFYSISDIDVIITSTILSLYPVHFSSIKISSFRTSGW